MSRLLCQGGLDVPSMAVSVSGREFMRPDILVRISERVEQACLPPSIFGTDSGDAAIVRASGRLCRSAAQYDRGPLCHEQARRRREPAGAFVSVALTV